MARKNKNQVVLTFAGDSDQLEKAFDRVGAASKEMSDEVGAASKEMASAGEGFDSAAEKADELDTKAMGFRDTMTGVQDTMRGVGEISRGNLFEGFFTLGMGIGDLASGFANFLIPTMKQFITTGVRGIAMTVKSTAVNAVHKAGLIASTVATKAMAVAQKALNLAMRANPILLIVGLLFTLGSALVVAYNKSETFRNIVQGAMRGVQRAFGWVLDRGRDVLNWFRNLPRNIGRFLSGLGRAITAPFRAGLSGIKSIWNSTIGGRGFSVPSWVPGIGGREFRIPFLHKGGVVPGAPGQDVLTILEGGERVTPAGAAPPAAVIEIRSGGTALDDALVEILARAVRVRGGNVQLVLGA